MAEDRMALIETLRKATAGGDVDMLREGVRVLAQAIMEAEVSELTGVAHGERDPEHRAALTPWILLPPSDPGQPSAQGAGLPWGQGRTRPFAAPGSTRAPDRG